MEYRHLDRLYFRHIPEYSGRYMFHVEIRAHYRIYLGFNSLRFTILSLKWSPKIKKRLGRHKKSRLGDMSPPQHTNNIHFYVIVVIFDLLVANLGRFGLENGLMYSGMCPIF